MTLLVSLIMAPPILYLNWRYYTSIKLLFTEKRWVRFVTVLILASFYLFPLSGLIDFYLTNSISILKYPKPLVYWFWFGLIFVFQLLTWVIIADIVKIWGRFVTDNTTRVYRIHAKVLLFLWVPIFIFTGWKVYAHTTTVKVDEIRLSLKKLPAELEHFTIVHISDIQGDEYTGQQDIASYIRKVNEQDPDLIIFTGDLISYGRDYIQMAAQELGRAKATYGTVAVVGDHDYWAGVEHVKEALEEQKIPLLQGENYTVNINDSLTVLVSGVTQVYDKQADPQVVDSLMSAADGQALKILASHQVSQPLINSAHAFGYDMLLAGHTHGGQIRVPFMGMSFSASDLETDFVSGLYYAKNILINVNNGFGFTLAPIRYNAPPTVSVITVE